MRDYKEDINIEIYHVFSSLCPVKDLYYSFYHYIYCSFTLV